MPRRLSDGSNPADRPRTLFATSEPAESCVPGDGLVKSLDEDEEGVGGPLLFCACVGSCSGEETAHVVGVQLCRDPSERVHERGAAIAHQRALESDQAVDFFGVLHQGRQCFKEQSGRFAFHKDIAVRRHDATLRRAPDIPTGSLRRVMLLTRRTSRGRWRLRSSPEWWCSAVSFDLRG